MAVQNLNRTEYTAVRTAPPIRHELEAIAAEERPQRVGCNQRRAVLVRLLDYEIRQGDCAMTTPESTKDEPVEVASSLGKYFVCCY